MRSTLSALWKASRLQLRFFLVVLAGYFVQVCVMPYLRINSVTPSMLLVVVAVVTVGYDRWRTLWVGCLYGILMELMLPSLKMLNLLFYPISALCCSLAFADMSEKRLEMRRTLNPNARNWNPYLRTVLCAGANTILYEVTNVIYIYLGGAELSGATFSRAATNVVYTSALALVLMLPLRRYLGFRKQNKEKEPVRHYQADRI